MKKLITTAIAIAAISSTAKAEYIEAPNFPKGTFQANDTFAFSHDADDEVVNTIEFAYGITDWLAVVAAFNQKDGEGLEIDYYSGGEYTAQFNLIKDEGEYIPATALRLTYGDASISGESDEMGVMGVFQKNIGPFDNFLNVAVSKSIGSDAEGGLNFGVAAQSMYNICDQWAIGAEYFGDMGKLSSMQSFDEQGHQLGPIIGFMPTDNIQTSINYLVGLSHEAPTSAIAVEFNITF